MYKNTGDKINNWAAAIAFFEFVGSILAGGLVIILGFVWARASSYPERMVFVSCAIGVVIAIGGSLAAWRKHLLLAGFGELVEKTCEISAQVAELKGERNVESEEREQPATTEEVSSMKSDTVNLETLDECVPKWKILRQCLDQGIITEEEYEKKMQELYK